MEHYLSTLLVSCPSRLSLSLFTILFFIYPVLALTPCSAQNPGATTETSRIELHLVPGSKTTVYNKIIVFPFLDDTNRPTPNLTDYFFQALKSTNKYKLSPAKDISHLLPRNTTSSSQHTFISLAATTARSSQARGAITGYITSPPRDHITKILNDRQSSTRLVISMLDTQTEKQVWSLSLFPLPANPDDKPRASQFQTLINQGIQKLLDTMVQQGDIFSTQVAPPRILSKQGMIRAVRVALQPSPLHIHSAYQLLRAKKADAVFQPVSAPQPNNRAPLILNDKNLQDSTTYFYTVIGINNYGLASIPVMPFTITTTGKPEPVSRFHALGNGLRQIQLSWEPSLDPNVDGYTIYRATEEEGPYEKIVTVADHDQQNYIDRGNTKIFARYGNLEDNTRYFYTIRSKNIVGVESIDSARISATTKGAPMPPIKIQASSRHPRSIPISWDAATDHHIKGYAIFKSSDPNGPYKHLGFVDGRQTQEYVDQGTWDKPLKNDTRYYYRLQSINVVDVHSTDSESVSAVTKAAPTAVQNVKTSKGLLKTIQLTWKKNTETDIMLYEVYRGDLEDSVSDKILTIDDGATTCTDDNLDDGRTYWYRIRAVDRDQLRGTLSATVSGSTKPRPKQPTGLRATVVEQGIQLTWDNNQEQDISHYLINTVGFFKTIIGKTEKTSFLVKTDIQTGEEYNFQIRAGDTANLISDYSLPVSISSPLTPQ